MSIHDLSVVSKWPFSNRKKSVKCHRWIQFSYGFYVQPSLEILWLILRYILFDISILNCSPDSSKYEKRRLVNFEMSFWYLQFSQKTIYYGTSSRIVFVRFWGELKTPRRHFEINWHFVWCIYFLFIFAKTIWLVKVGNNQKILSSYPQKEKSNY